MDPVTMAVIMGGTAALQARQAQARRKQQERFNKGQAEVTRYSPWTDMRSQMDNAFVPDALSAAAGGAIQGAGVAQGLQGLMGGAPATPQPSAGQFMDQMQQAQPMAPSSMNMQPGLYGNPWGNIA